MERECVRPDQLDESLDRFRVDADARRDELSAYPGRVVVLLAAAPLSLRHVVAENVPDRSDRVRQPGELPGLADEREDSTRVRAANVLRHGLDVALLPPLDLLDDDEPLASSEQSERVRRRDSVGPGRALGRETLDRALGEARAEAADGESDLRLIAARDQVRGLERLGCHRASLGRAPCVPPDQAAVRTSILRPSVSTVTVPSRSVRKSRSDGTSDSAVSVDGAGCP